MANGTRRTKLRINRWVALAFGAFVAGGVVLVPMLAGASAVGSVSVTPTTVTAGAVSIDFNFDRGAKGKYIVDIAIPSGWTGVSASLPAGTDKCGMSSNTVTGHIQYKGNCNGNNAPYTVTVRVAATVATADTYSVVIKSGDSDTTAALGNLATQDITVNPGPANKLAFTQQPSGGAVNTVWTTQPIVTVQDSSGNTVNSEAAVTLAAPGSGLTCTTNPVNASAGVATFGGCKATTPGPYTLTASSPGLLSATTSITISQATLSTTASSPNGPTYFQCASGAGQFGDDVNFTVTNVPTTADSARVTIGSTNVSLTKDATVNTKWTGSLAKGNSITYSPCPADSNSPPPLPYSATAFQGATQIGSGSGSYQPFKTDQ